MLYKFINKKKMLLLFFFFAEEERERDVQYSTVIRQGPGPGPLGVVAMQSAKPREGGALFKRQRQRSTLNTFAK